MQFVIFFAAMLSCDGVCGVQAQVIGAAPVYQMQQFQQIVPVQAQAVPYAVQAQAAPVCAAPQVLAAPVYAAPVVVRQQAVIVKQAAPLIVKNRGFVARGRSQGVARQVVGGGGSVNINAARGARVKVR